MYIRIKEAAYWVEQYGEGEPLLFLHGFTGSARTWHALRPFFPEYQMILIDLPGHGKTKDPSITTMQDCCEAIHAILHKLEINKVHLIGYSMGGRTALSFAYYFPDMVKSMVIESASPGIEDAGERKEREERDQVLASFLQKYSMEAFVDKWESLPLFATQKKLPEAARHAIRQERLSQNADGLIQSLLTMGTGVMPPLWDQLSHLRCPCLLIAGEHDQKFVVINKKMNRRIPKSKLKLIQGAGHAIHVEQPHVFGTIVEKFITDAEHPDKFR